MQAIRLILIDDHAIVREGLRALLEEDPEFQVVGEFANGQDALAAVSALRPDVAISDLRMPGLSAVETIRGLRRLVPTLHVMLFTSFAESQQIRDVLDAGALGYVLKDASHSELKSALRYVAHYHNGAHRLR